MNTPETTKESVYNRLRLEKSPYLLQHADNPVDWYPWGEEAFRKAREDDKPIFLSIGYSTCHWCHVMAHESFEDPKTAGMMNEAFVCIKVDREERPDIDQVYTEACRMMTGSGGWPLTIIMTPDKKPFFVGTYLPRETRFGRIGLTELIARVKDFRRNRREDIEKTAREVVAALGRVTKEGGRENINKGILSKAYMELFGRFDRINGGFGVEPKFPTPHNLLFLLRYHKRSGEKRALEMVEQTLGAMRRGGIFDHVGFGFHRYSTDAAWRVPHFEKMLYDQALLTMAYTEAYQATGNESYSRTAKEVLTYVLRDMRSPEGGFYSAEDADSEGVEGKFYLWTTEEIKAALDSDELELATELFGVRPAGNFERDTPDEYPREHILYLPKSPADIAEGLGISEEALRQRMDVIRRKLYRRREKRIRPGKDDKILTDWNGLMIAALASAGATFEDDGYIHAAEEAAEFVLGSLCTPEGRLLHRYRNGSAGIVGNADDYAFMIWGLVNLYEATFNPRYLEQASNLNMVFMDLFYDAGNGGFFFTAEDAETILIRRKEIQDGATPSANSVGMLNLLRLGRLLGDASLEARADETLKEFASNVNVGPSAFAMFLTAFDFAVGPTFEVVIVGEPHWDETTRATRALAKRFLPNKVVLFRPSGEDSPEIDRVVGFTKDFSSVRGKTTIYVCRDRVCKTPTVDPSEMLSFLMTD